MNFRHLVRPVARAVGAAIGFRARLRPARRGSDPERDEKFESGSWRAPAAVRAGLAGEDGPPKRIFSAPRLPSKTSKRERRHRTRRSPKSSNKELGEERPASLRTPARVCAGTGALRRGGAAPTKFCTSGVWRRINRWANHVYPRGEHSRVRACLRVGLEVVLRGQALKHKVGDSEFSFPDYGPIIGCHRQTLPMRHSARNRLDGPVLGLLSGHSTNSEKYGETGTEQCAKRRESLQRSCRETPRNRSRMSVATSAARNTCPGRTLRTQSRGQGSPSLIWRLGVGR